MRNLKRVLSLTLASVMLLGMMVVGSSAAAGFPDVDENDNIEAIEVLQAVEVMVGDDRGFGPDRPVTRNEMAVVMGKLLNLDYNYYVSTCPFNDVANWARGWVGACYANGIVSGRGQGVYDGESTVTAIEAASMMMRALGYFKNIEDYADGFATVTVRQGSQIGIFNMVGTDATSPMTRNQVAQMALNALRSEMVDFTGTPGIEVNGVKVGYKAEYTPRTSTEAKYNAIEGRTSDVASDLNHKGQYYIQLGEELYDGDLRLYNDATDDFGRPSRKWEYDGKAIGTYMKKELMDKEWTVEVKGKDLYDLLGADTIKNYEFEITIDGITVGEKTGVTDNDKILDENAKSFFDQTYMTKTYKTGVGKTGKGVLTQVFVDPEEGKAGKVWVSVINTYLAKAASDYNEKKDEAKLDVYGLTKTTSTAEKDTIWYKEAADCSKKDQESKAISVAAEDFLIAEDIKADDFFLVTVSNGEIKTLVEPEVISAATLNEFSKDSYVINESTKYEYNTTIEYDPETLENYTSKGNGNQELKDTEYNLFLDAYGYLIGVEIVEKVNNYIFLTGIDQGTSNLKNRTSEAAGILMDGTFIEFKMNMNDSKAWNPNHKFVNDGTNNADKATKAVEVSFVGHPLWNTWCTYTVDKDGVYTLKEVRDTINTDKGVKIAQTHDTDYADRTIDHKHVSLKGGAGYTYVYGNDDTVYIVPELMQIATDTAIDANTVNVPTNTTAPSTNLNVKAPVGIISGVESVTTGIDNVDLQTWTLAQIKEQDSNKLNAANNVLPGNVYTLYNKDGYVIAAVVLGEDNGTTKNLVYSHKSSIESEKYNSADDEWTWTRKVIKDGEEILLTQTGDKLKDDNIYDMTQNTWYEVNLKADGTVKNVKHAYYTEEKKETTKTVAASHALDLTNGTTKDKAHDFVDNITYLENATANSNKTTVLYEQVWTVSKAPELKGSTLYVDVDASKGFYVNKDNVKTVLIQTNNSESTTTYYDTIGELEDVLDDLNVIDSKYNFKISAIMTDGRATVVIIHDWNETEGQKGDKPAVSGTYTSTEAATGATPVAAMDMSKAEINDSLELKVPALYMGKNVRGQLEEILESMGYKVTKTVYDGTSKYTFTVNKDGKEMDVTCDTGSDITDKYFLLDNNGTKTFEKSGSKSFNIAKTSAADKTDTGWAYKQTGDTYYKWGAAYGSAQSITINKDTVIESGYVKVDNNEPSAANAAKYKTDFVVGPKASSGNGTGYSYATTKYVAYSGTIPADDVTGNITLTANQVKVTYSGFETAADNKTVPAAYDASNITVPAAGTNAGTGAKLTNATSTSIAYAAYGASNVTVAGGNDVTIEAGYVKVTVTPAVTKTGASTAWATTTATAALASGQAACVSAAGGTINVTITTAAAATAGAVTVSAGAGNTVSPNTIASGTAIGAIATPFAVTVGAQTNDLTLTIEVNQS